MTKQTRILEIRKNGEGAGALDSAFGFRYSFVVRNSGFVITPCLLRVITASRTSFAVLLFLVCNGCAHMPSTTAPNAESQVPAVSDAKARAWNAGALPGILVGYRRSARSRF